MTLALSTCSIVDQALLWFDPAQLELWNLDVISPHDWVGYRRPFHDDLLNGVSVCKRNIRTFLFESYLKVFLSERGNWPQVGMHDSGL